jgi:putative ABC transport system substrate-binding protein
MDRRRFLGALGGAVAGSAVAGATAGHAQDAAKTLRVATANAQPRTAPQWLSFVQRMADLGYREGRNFVFDYVQVPDASAWDAAYREVVARKPDIVLGAGPESSLKAALAAAGGLPVVMLAVDYDPLAKGYVRSLSRPGANVTGLYFQSIELLGKRLELVKQAVPHLTTMVVFWDKASADHWAAVGTVAQQFGLQLKGVEFHERPYDYERALVEAGGAGNLLYAGGSPFFFLDRTLLAEIAIRHRMAVISEVRELAFAGNLMSYGPSLTAMFALAATYVDRIAKGARPGDLPVEQPTQFEFVVNLRTARALGIDIPQLLLARADEIIE